MRFLLVVLVLLLDALHFRRHLAHFRHGAIAGGTELEEDRLDSEREQDNGNTPVTDAHANVDIHAEHGHFTTLQEYQQGKDGLGDKPQPAVIHSHIQTGANRLQLVLLLGPGIELGVKHLLFARRHLEGRRHKPQQVLTAFFQVHAGVMVLLLGIRHPGSHKIVLRHGQPTTLDRQVQRVFRHFFKIEFVIRRFAVPVGATQIGGHRNKTTIGQAGIFTAITLDLAIQGTGPLTVALVTDNMADAHQVAAAFESETLDQLGAIILTQGQVHIQFLGAFIQLVALLGCTPQWTAGAGISAVLANQATLSHIGAAGILLKQHEGLVRGIHMMGELRQRQANDITALGIDFHSQHIGVDPNALLASCGFRGFGRRGFNPL